MKIAKTIALIIAASQGQAGPDEITDYFMDTSPSMLDFGILRLERRLKELESGQRAHVSYDWDRDVIEVYTVYFSDEEGDCKSFIGEVRTSAGFNLEGELWFGKRSHFASLFSHSGYIRGEQSDSDRRLIELDKKFRISCRSGSKLFEADLPGKGIAVTE